MVCSGSKENSDSHEHERRKRIRAKFSRKNDQKLFNIIVVMLNFEFWADFRMVFDSVRRMTSASPIGLAAQRRVDVMVWRCRVVPEGRAFAAAKRFEQARREARRLFRTSGSYLLNASNDGFCGFLGRAVRFFGCNGCGALRALRDAVIHAVPIGVLAPRCGTCGSSARGLRRSRAASRVFGRRRAFRATLRGRRGLSI